MNSDALHQQVLAITKKLEEQVDSTISEIDNLDGNALEQLRKSRVRELKDLTEKRRNWVANGHGVYEELAEEKMFFDVIKKSENVVLHMFSPTSHRSSIFDMHLKKIAAKHLETRFISLNAHRCPFLAERLKIKVLPSLICTQNGIMVDKIVGFTTLGNRDDFTTKVLEWRLGQNNVINYDGDLSVPPDEQVVQSKPKSNGKIRDGIYNDGSDDDDDASYDLRNCSLNGPITSNNLELTEEELQELGLDDVETDTQKDADVTGGECKK